MDKLNAVFGTDDYGEFFEWRATIGGAVYGSRINAGVGKSFDDIGIAHCVRQMHMTIQKVVYGETPEEREVKMAKKVSGMLEELMR